MRSLVEHSPRLLLGATLALAAGAHCAAAPLRVQVVDERGQPVAGVAVYATPDGPAASPASAATPTAVMDQAGNAFVPHILIVQTGTQVLFPNNDSVSHHVYSFSEAKTFELGLYKGDVYPPVRFEKPGVVVLGCNIHDGMLGYIVVVATPQFGLTDRRGTLELDLADGAYAVDIWTPRARPGSLPAASRLTLASAPQEVAFQIRGKLAPDHDHRAPSLSWERY